MSQEKSNFSAANQEIMSSPAREFPDFTTLKDAEFDTGTLWDRVNGDAALLRDLVAIFAAQGPELLSEIRMAIDQGSPDCLRRASHKMRGSALQFSAPDAAALAGTLERLGKEGTLEGAREALLKLQKSFQALISRLQVMVNSGESL